MELHGLNGLALPLTEIASNSDTIDYGEMIHVYDGTDEGSTTFTYRGIESLQEFPADVCSWEGGVCQFLLDQQCDPEKIEWLFNIRAYFMPKRAKQKSDRQPETYSVNHRSRGHFVALTVVRPD